MIYMCRKQKTYQNEDNSLQNTKYLWLKNPNNLTEQDTERLFEIIYE